MPDTLKLAAGTAKEAGAMPYIFGFGVIAAIVAGALLISKKLREGVSSATAGAGAVLKAGGTVATKVSEGVNTLVKEGENLSKSIGDVLLSDPSAGYTVFMYPVTHEHLAGIYDRTLIHGERLEGDRLSILNYWRNANFNIKLSRPTDIELPASFGGELIQSTGLTATDWGILSVCYSIFSKNL